MKDQDFISSNSPKNKYRAEAHFAPASKTQGSVLSTGAMSIELCIERIKAQLAAVPHHSEHIVIKENAKAWPEFDWHVVHQSSTGIYNRGGAREGAGRKRQDTVAVSCRISRAARAELDRAAQAVGKSIGAYLDSLILSK